MMQNLLRRKEMKQIIITFLSFLCFSSLSAGITGKIAGKVTDASTGEPLPGVNVIIVGTLSGGASDIDGDYYIINVPPGEYSLKATMIGYASQLQTKVQVRMDQTAIINFKMKPETISGEEIVVVAKRPVVEMDVSSSQEVTNGKEIVANPMVTSIEDYLNLQAGIEDGEIRGGSIDQTGFLMDGLAVVDNRTNRPISSINLSAVKELSVIKGGFNAEYGNIRSGLVNVVLKEGNSDKYNGYLDLQMSPAHLKHSGASLFSPDNYYIRPYVDPDVCWEGTANGNWSEEMQASYPSFLGWDQYAAALAMDDNPDNDMTPKQARELFMYQHRIKGSGKYGQKEGEYGNIPDYIIDASFSGPFPFISKSLGGLKFFASYRLNKDAFALPTSRDYYSEENTILKLTSNITPTIKVSIEGNYGKTQTVASVVDYIQNGRVDYVTSGDDILWSELTNSEEGPYTHRGSGNLYWPSSLAPFNIYHSMLGFSIDHVISKSTYYKLRVSNVRVKNSCRGPDSWRDTTTVRHFGNVAVDEQPYGFWWKGGYKGMVGDGMLYSAIGAGARDYSEVNTINAKFDLTSQINKHNQVKTGFVFNYDHLQTHFEKVSQYAPGDSWVNKWTNYPIRTGAYLQDKIEFKGLIANIGLRLDYIQPNTKWPDVDRYSKYLSKQYKNNFMNLAQKRDAKSHLKVSPRIGVSHPITENAKLYFNYGHFYSMSPAFDMYQIDYGLTAQGITFLGNPSADLPRTISYELGFEYDIANMYLIHLAGYYKDVSSQTGPVSYENIDGSVSYETIENNNYADIKGFEFKLEKRYGTWFTGWINYNYMVTTNGYTGRRNYFEDPSRQRLEGLQNPYMEVPLAQPYARMNLKFHIPDDFGPALLGYNILKSLQLNTIVSWQSGYYETWDPLKTFRLKDNIQWKDYWMTDVRLSKNVLIGRYNFLIYMDVHNLFDNRMIDDIGFSSGADRRRYLQSLHLPMYKGKEYQLRGYTGGNDRPGDVKSADKPYIDMPDRAFLTYTDLRDFVFGIKIIF